MKNGSIRILDCTLRDGGYCNQWKFGRRNIEKIIAALNESSVDIIECGFLTDKTSYVADNSKFTEISQVGEFTQGSRKSTIYTVMINYGEYDPEKLPQCAGGMVDGIRVAFHKGDMLPAIEFCRKVVAKGYKVFMQPMLSLSYTDAEFLDLISRSNEFMPYAFYIVDSFGSMRYRDLMRLYYLVDNNLNENIYMGFHSHNNLQLAFSNALHLIEKQSFHDLIIDASIMGMGRGAGNLNTELIMEHMNSVRRTEYRIKPLLRVIDEVLNMFYADSPWGYSLPHYISASHGIHPNYAGYLADKCTLTVEDMEEIFSMMPDGKRVRYDKAYIEELYKRYMKKGHINETHLVEFKESLSGKTVLVVAPGRSGLVEKERIIHKSRQDGTVLISINVDYPYAETDFIFVSNLRRFRQLPKGKWGKCIVTSNINADGVYLQTGYEALLNETEMAGDNAGLMLVKYLISLGVDTIFLAGMDGYSHDREKNYASRDLETIMRIATMDAINESMDEMLEKFSRKATIKFLTKPHFVGNFLGMVEV